VCARYTRSRFTLASMSKKIPRLEMNELAANVQQTLAARVKRLGYLGEFFKCSGHNPDVLVSFMEMTEALKKALPDRLTEVGSLTVAGLMGNDYERNQHERLSEKLGFGREWVAAVNRLQPDADGPLSEDERSVQRLGLALIARHGKNVDAELDAVIERIGTRQAMAVLFLIGRYVMHAYVVNALNLTPPVPSIFAGETS
jgi:alkylhydroperoxidase family enzyme